MHAFHFSQNSNILQVYFLYNIPFFLGSQYLMQPLNHALPSFPKTAQDGIWSARDVWEIICSLKETGGL